MNWQNRNYKVLLKNLALLNHKFKGIEVLVSDYELNDFNDDKWNNCRQVAKFKDYTTALQFACDLADQKYFWTGGVLIR